jgi:ferrochelatase
VFRYLNEFLTDERVIDIPWWRRQLLVRGIIVPTRFRSSTKAYQAIWTKEGSPLMVHSLNLKRELQEKLGCGYRVEIAMRYQNPSIASGLNKLKRFKEIIVVPLFPQYASATTGSVHQKVMECVGKWIQIPKITFIDSYYDHPHFIQAFADISQKYDIEAYDKILFSFHGLPVRQLVKGGCQWKGECCHSLTQGNQGCYSAQCYQTAYKIAEKLNLERGRYRVSFQSRLGKDPWMEPYTTDTLRQLRKEGAKKILVFCPAFVSDCLETIYEIGVEYAEEFKHLGGEKLDLVEGLNDHPSWVLALEQLITKG